LPIEGSEDLFHVHRNIDSPPTAQGTADSKPSRMVKNHFYQENNRKKSPTAGHQWLTPVILVTQEAEVSRIKVQSQPGKLVIKILSRKSPTQKRAGGAFFVLSSGRAPA
jgi:hypothetical protein